MSDDLGLGQENHGELGEGPTSASASAPAPAPLGTPTSAAAPVATPTENVTEAGSTAGAMTDAPSEHPRRTRGDRSRKATAKHKGVGDASRRRIRSATHDGRTFEKGTRVWSVLHPMFDGTVEEVTQSELLGETVLVRWDKPLFVAPTENEIAAALEATPEGERAEAEKVLRADPCVSGNSPRSLRLATEPVPALHVKRGDEVRLAGRPESRGYVADLRIGPGRGNVFCDVSWSVPPQEAVLDAELGSGYRPYGYLELEAIR